MPVTLQALTEGTAVTTVHHGEQEADVTYRPGMLTGENIDKFIGAATGADNGQASDGFYSFFVDTVVDWDVMNGNRKMPITVPSLKKLPLPFLNNVITEIMQDQRAGKANQETSGSFSPRAVRRAKPRSGRA